MSSGRVVVHSRCDIEYTASHYTAWPWLGCDELSCHRSPRVNVLVCSPRCHSDRRPNIVGERAELIDDEWSRYCGIERQSSSGPERPVSLENGAGLAGLPLHEHACIVKVQRLRVELHDIVAFGEGSHFDDLCREVSE